MGNELLNQFIRRGASGSARRRRTAKRSAEDTAFMQSYPQYLMLLPKEEDELLVQVDASFRIRQWGGRGGAILGFNHEELVGRPYPEILTERQRSSGEFERILGEIGMKGAPSHFEIEHQTKANEPILLRGVASPLRTLEGQPDGWLLVMRRAIEERCLDCRLLNYLEAITADSADGIIILDAGERIQSWNRGAEEIYGFKASEILGKPLQLLVPRDLVEAGELTFLRKTLEEKGYVRNYETIRVRKDGQSIRVELTRSAIHDGRGRVIGSSVIVRDVTNRKRLEERLLHTERLATVGRMAAQVAHELRNPLSSISLNAELLADELSTLPEEHSHEAKSLLTSISKEIERLAAVSEEYLQFARLPELSPAPTDVTLLVEDLAEFTELELAKAGVAVRVETQEVPNIPVDRKQLRQALINLIRNALEAMTAGGTLSLQTYLAAERDAIEIAVADTGHGIPLENVPQIFEPFYSTKEGGTGLGLSLARRVAHEHGGELVYRPTPGGGATFVMRLPLQGVVNKGIPAL